MNRLTHFFRSKNVRTRLMLAFTVLSCSVMMLALVGWLGLSNTDQALKDFEQQALPDISRSLELAERTANLAAIAPYVTNTSSPFMLQGLSKTLEEKISTVLLLAKEVPQLDAAAPNLSALLERLEVTVDELIELTRAQLFLREDILQYEYRLNFDASHIDQYSGSVLLAAPSQQVSHLIELLKRSINLKKVDDINKARLDFKRMFGELEPLRSLNAEQQALVKGWRDNVSDIGIAKAGLFDLRLEQLALQQRGAFLLASTRAISEQLSGEVKLFVDQVQERIADQSQRVGRAVRSGKTGIMAITVFCIAAALGGIYLVREMVTSLGAVTRVMTRLAAGDKYQNTPAVERCDEIGDLARAFQVFRENAVKIDRISHDFQEQSRLLETVFNNINDGLSVFDKDGKLVAWNPRYLSILELPADKLSVSMTIDQVHGLLSREAQESWALDGMALDKDEINQLRQKRVQRFERRFANGRVVEFSSSPMPDGGFVTLYSDLTERKDIEAQLRQSQKMEVVGQLTGGVAHDFNNLLAAMFGNLQLLEALLPKEGKALIYAQRALAVAERGSNLTQRLLAFSRKQHLTPEAIEVDGLIEGMLDLIEYSVGSQISIQLDLQAEPWIVNVDPGQLENALLNLAINGSAAMPEGGSLSFTTRKLPDVMLNQKRVDVLQILVADTGCGISESHLRRVFEPFFTTKEIGEGSGLGLSMVYGFVKQSDGDIRVQSTLGRGTQIEILLPLAASLPALDSDTIDSQAINSETRAGHEVNLGAGEWVLMVEDDPQVRAVTEELLVLLNYQVIAVARAEAALDILLQRNDISLVFTDVNLGTAFNGLQLQRRIHQQWPDIPVLLTSGLSVRHLSDRYGMESDQYLLKKPYRQEMLARAISTALTLDEAQLDETGKEEDA